MSLTVVEQVCTGGIWVWGRPLLKGRGGWVVCYKMAQFSVRVRLRLGITLHYTLNTPPFYKRPRLTMAQPQIPSVYLLSDLNITIPGLLR